MKRLVSLVIAWAITCVSCISMDRIPSAAEIRNWSALDPFVLHPGSVTGVYQNIDIDSVVFYYVTNLTVEKEFWRTLHHRAALAGWQPVNGVASVPQLRTYEAFQRLTPKGELWFASAEELRIAYSPTRVVVAYVQSDQSGNPKPVSQSSEGRFADREIWPRFSQLVSDSGAS